MEMKYPFLQIYRNKKECKVDRTFDILLYCQQRDRLQIKKEKRKKKHINVEDEKKNKIKYLATTTATQKCTSCCVCTYLCCMYKIHRKVMLMVNKN